MTIRTTAPWHKESYDAFLSERLAGLLAERMPLAGYEVRPAGEHECTIAISISARGKVVNAAFTVPAIDEMGTFVIDGVRRVVVPTASCEDPAESQIRCVGEQLYDHIESNLGSAGDALPWDESLVRGFAPLDVWITRFLAGEIDDQRVKNTELSGRCVVTSQPLDEQNWLAVRTHIRRIMISDRKLIISHTQFGYLCPLESPEGQNIGRILSVAAGATICDGKLVRENKSAQGALGVTASMVPFIEHNDANRQLMGVNMMRQAIVPPDCQPASVQTGNEPSEPGFWCGRDFLTAFVSMGADTFEDGIVVSESAADRMTYGGTFIPHNRLEPGDKLSNRHGTKGTVSRILPDSEMPHLEDGTPVELVFSPNGIFTRMNLGQLREAVMSRIARAEGSPAIVPPFCAPDADEIHSRLAAAGLPESGMERLTLGQNGDWLDLESTVGWVYWFKLHHMVSDKINFSTTSEHCNYQGLLEYYQLRHIGAFETIAETYNMKSVDHPEAETLAQRVADGEIPQASVPSPRLAQLIRALQAACIRVDVEGETLQFAFDAPQEGRLALACDMPHPWQNQQTISEIGIIETPAFAEVEALNNRLRSLIDSRAPQGLRDAAATALGRATEKYFDELLEGTSDSFCNNRVPSFGNRVIFSGRSVIAPANGMLLDTVGLPDEMARTLFGPMVANRLGSDLPVDWRSDGAEKALDATMAESWVIVNRAPAIMPTSLLAFHPVRVSDRVIRLHPLATRLMNADFDGDMAAVFVPVTPAGQEEAGRLLSVAGHLRRDPELVQWLVHGHAPMYGFARLSLKEDGYAELCDIAGVAMERPEGFVTHKTLVSALRTVLAANGPEHMIDVLERLAQRGFAEAKRSGASIGPFFGEGLDHPPLPESDDLEHWRKRCQATQEILATICDYDRPDVGPQLLAVKSGARGSLSHLANLIGPRVLDVSFGQEGTHDGFGNLSQIVRRGFVDGLTSEELLAAAIPARVGMAMVALGCADTGYGLRRTGPSGGFTVVARAMRASHPGIVFARAAAIGECDPLTDLDSRLFAGLGEQPEG